MKMSMGNTQYFQLLCYSLVFSIGPGAIQWLKVLFVLYFKVLGDHCFILSSWSLPFLDISVLWRVIVSCSTSGKHVSEMYTPLNTTFI